MNGLTKSGWVANMTTALGLGAYAVLAAGSYASPSSRGSLTQLFHRQSGVSLAQIVQGAQLVTALLSTLQGASTEAAGTVAARYRELGDVLREQRWNTDEIARMEKSIADMRAKRSAFQQSLDKTKTAATELFALLESRARDNGNDKIRDRLLESIAVKKSGFFLQMDRAANVLLKVDSSIKGYDNILGTLQVQAGIGLSDQFTKEVNEILSQSTALSGEIQQAIQEGMKIVDPQYIN